MKYYSGSYDSEPYRVRTVPCPYRTVFRFFYRTVLSAKRTEPLILTVRILVFDREPYCTKMGTVISLLLRTAIHAAPKLVRCVPYNTNLQRLSVDRTK